MTGTAGRPTDHTDGDGSEHDLAPLGSEEEFTEEEFAALLSEIVAEDKPRLFSLCEEYGDRVDGRVLAWGMAFADRANVVGVDGRMSGTFQSPESALRLLSRRRKLRLLWCDSQPPEQDTVSAEPTQ
jgi:hypothetical protein